MTDTIISPESAKIAALNDAFRTTFSGGRVVITRGVRDMRRPAEAFRIVRNFTGFTEDNDPNGEHDFGAFDLDGERLFWKISYYDSASFGSGRDMGSEDPSDPEQTARVMTVMLASEY